MIIGLVVALPSLSNNKFLSYFNIAYVEIVRAIPLLVLILWIYYGLPIMTGISFSPFVSGIIALTISESAFQAEIFRAGINSINKGQYEVANSLGMNFWKKMRLVILPQAIKVVLPALGNQFVYVLKMSSLVSIIGIADLTRKANELVVSTYRQVFLNSKFDKVDQKTNKKIGEIKIEKPIEVLLEGADLNIYKPIKDSEFKELNLLKDINSIPEDFAFLAVGHWMQGSLGEDRKNMGVTVKSFYDTFKNKKKKPALILKTSSVNSSYMDRREIMKRIDIIRSSCGKNLPSIYLLHGNFTNQEMNELYNHPKIKAMVSHTRGRRIW